MLQITQPEYLTVMHAGDRTKEAIDAGGVLPGYAGVIVRDGYAGYDHLADALHAWCGAHNLRDLKDLYTADPDGQLWARSMADLLIDANAQATAARAAGQRTLSGDQLAAIRSWYRGAVAKGIADNQGRRKKIAQDGLRLARRFRDHQDMIRRFATDLAAGFTSNQAERDIRPVKVQQRSSGGTWRTLAGLADFAVVQSYLSTAAKWGIDALDVLTRLFTDGPWLPPAASRGRCSGCAPATTGTGGGTGPANPTPGPATPPGTSLPAKTWPAARTCCARPASGSPSPRPGWPGRPHSRARRCWSPSAATPSPRSYGP